MFECPDCGYKAQDEETGVSDMKRKLDIESHRVFLLANIIMKLSAKSDFRRNDDGSYRYDDSEPVLGRDEGTITRGDIRFAAQVLAYFPLDNVTSLDV